MNEISADVLEQAAMAKTYNDSMPDDFVIETIEDVENMFESPITKISKWVSNMGSEGLKNEASFSVDFRYIEVEDWNCHYITFGNMAFMIPSEYTIDYASIKENDSEYGKLQFKKDKEYAVEYLYIPINVFEAKIRELESSPDLIDSFITETGKRFYEFKNDGLYVYTNDYMWKISGCSKENISEYYNMYSILISISDDKKEKTEFLKSMYISNRQSLESQGKETADLSFHIENRFYQEVLDEEYSIYKRRNNPQEKNVSVIDLYYDEKWYFQGVFQAEILGEYHEGEILEFTEISESEELSELDKKEMLARIIDQRQLSISESKDTIRDSLFLILFKELQSSLSFDMFQKYEMVNFLKIESISVISKTENNVYQFMKKEIDSYTIEAFAALQSGEASDELLTRWKKTLSYIDSVSFVDQVVPISVKVSPEFVLFGCQIFNKTRHFILMDSNSLVEWN